MVVVACGGRVGGGGWGWGEMVLSTHIWAVNGFVTLNTVYFLPLEQGQFFSESLIDYS